MNREQYNSDTRYEKVLHNMDLLGIMDITTTRQHKNSTIVWRLPIKINYPGNADRFIEVASFSTGYVRNQNCGYSNYQLNKRCEGKPEYFQLDNGDFRKFTTRSCVLIPNEIDRLEYLIAYCLKNYYIKNANQVANGKYVSQWEHEYRLDQAKCNAEAESINDCGHYDRINDLEEKLDAMTEDRDCAKDYSVKLEEKLYDLQNKLATIERIARINASYR